MKVELQTGTTALAFWSGLEAVQLSVCAWQSCVHVSTDSSHMTMSTGGSPQLKPRCLATFTALSPGSAGSPRSPDAGANQKQQLAGECRTTPPPMLDMQCLVQ